MKKMKKINKKIKELFKTQIAFCEFQKYKPKDFLSKKNTVKNKIDWLNEFLKPLNLKIKIVNVKSEA